MKTFLTLTAMTLALAGCGKGGSDTGGTSPAAPIAAVKAPAGQSWTDTVVKTDEGYRVGNPNAPVKMVEYGSRLCPACGALARDGFDPLLNTYVKSGKVSLEFREFLIHGAPDLPPALLGYCVEPTAFFPLLEAMYHDQQQFNDALMKTSPAVQQAIQAAGPVGGIGKLADAEGIVAWVQQRGIPEAKARQCLADSKVIDQLTKQTQDRGNDGTVTGTPTVLINGAKVEGPGGPSAAIGWSDVEKALKAHGA